MSEPESLEGRLRQDEGLGFLDRDDVGRSRKAVEDPDFSEEVARLEHAYALRAFVALDEHLERAPRDDEEAAVEVPFVDSELARFVQPCLRMLKNDLEVSLVQVGKKSVLSALVAQRRHSTFAEALESITFWTTSNSTCHAGV
jgi:hypothetical protein